MRRRIVRRELEAMSQPTHEALSQRGDAVRITLRVKPRASRTRILGFREGALEIAVAAPPVDGAANEAVVAAMAEALHVPQRAVAIVSGATGKNKVVEVAGTTLVLVTSAFEGASAK
jgi:uncharacterized protein (TIGR00251 family)